MLKIDKDNEHGTRFKCKLKTSFLIFSNIYCWYILELPHRGNSNVYLQYNYVFPILKCFNLLSLIH